MGKRVNYFYCSKCAAFVTENDRVPREGTKGWVCPKCGIGLYKRRSHIIEESPDIEELLAQPLVDMPPAPTPWEMRSNDVPPWVLRVWRRAGIERAR